MGILARAVERRAHPSTIKNPALYGLASSSPASSGVDVTEDKALESSAVWAAVRLLSGTVGTLPLPLYRRLERGKERATEHELYRILDVAPNDEMVAVNFRQAQMSSLLLWGNAYAEKDINEGGHIVALWPLIPGNMRPFRTSWGETVYLYRLADGTEISFPRRKILHTVGFSQHGLLGYNVVEKQRESIGLTLGLSEYAGRFFGNNARPDAVLEHPGSLDPKAKDLLRRKWEEMHQGLSQSHRVAILEEGMKLHEFSVNPEQAQLIESRKFSIAEVARVFGIPNHMIGDLEKSSFSNIEEMSREFVTYALNYWLILLEQTYNVQLLSPEDQEEYFWEHLVEGLLRGQTQQRFAAYATARQWGWMSANDVRELENLNPIEDGDIYLIPMNMVPANMAGESPLPKESSPQQTEPESDEEPEESSCKCEDIEHRDLTDRQKRFLITQQRTQSSFRNLIKESAQRTVNREITALERLIKKHLITRDSSSYDAAVKLFYKEFHENVTRDMNPVFRAFAESSYSSLIDMLEAGMGIEEHLEAFTKEYVFTYGKRYTGRSLAEIINVMKETKPDELAVGMEDLMHIWRDVKAKQIAAAETIRFSNAVGREAFKKSGVRKLRWVTIGSDNCPFCTSLNGRVVGIEEQFLGEEDWVKLKGSQWHHGGHDRLWSSFHPPIHNGCDCVIVPS